MCTFLNLLESISSVQSQTQLSVYILRLLISADQFQRGLALSLSLHHKGEYCAPGMITEIQVVYSRVIAARKFSNKYSAET